MAEPPALPRRLLPHVLRPRAVPVEVNSLAGPSTWSCRRVGPTCASLPYGAS